MVESDRASVVVIGVGVNAFTLCRYPVQLDSFLLRAALDGEWVSGFEFGGDLPVEAVAGNGVVSGGDGAVIVDSVVGVAVNGGDGAVIIDSVVGVAVSVGDGGVVVGVGVGGSQRIEKIYHIDVERAQLLNDTGAKYPYL